MPAIKELIQGSSPMNSYDSTVRAARQDAIGELVEQVILDGDVSLARSLELMISRISDEDDHIYDMQLRRLRDWQRERRNSAMVSVTGSEVRFMRDSHNIILTNSNY